MPKDWDSHKAEIERLYMVEHRPLKDVRNILRMQRAFDASIRSYRMKLDEWQMWKNSSKTERRRTKTMSRRRQSRAVPVSQSLGEASSSAEQISASAPPVDISGLIHSDVFYGIYLPWGSLDIAELLPLISSLCSKPECGLELMLIKWKSDGSYFEAALNYLWENKATFRIKFHTLAGTSIFRCIDDNVAPHEKYCLAKMCLKLDFEQAQHKHHGFQDSIPEWVRLWREACASQTWKDVKKYLDRINSDIVGSFLFVSTALPFLAEKLLQKNMQRLERWRDQEGFISISEAKQADLCLQESMDILGSFKTDDFDIDTIWYKRFLQFKETDGPQLWVYKNVQLDHLREYQQKFSQLQVLHGSADSADGLVPNLLNAARVLKESKGILNTVQCEDVPLTNEYLSPHPSTPVIVRRERSHRPFNELRMLLEGVYENWGFGLDIGTNVDCLLRHLKSFSTSAPLNPEKNIFILIRRIVPPKNQVSFTVDVLDAFTKSRLFFSTEGLGFCWDFWIAIRDSSTLESLVETVAGVLDIPEEIISSLDDRMQQVVVNLILDAFAGLVGEQVLMRLKANIKRRHASGLQYDMSLHDYKAILDSLHRRGVKVNQSLFAFLGRLLVWEGTGENGNEEEEERMFFETSDDESNDSESECLESEIESEDQ